MLISICPPAVLIEGEIPCRARWKLSVSFFLKCSHSSCSFGFAITSYLYQQLCRISTGGLTQQIQKVQSTSYYKTTLHFLMDKSGIILLQIAQECKTIAKFPVPFVRRGSDLRTGLKKLSRLWKWHLMRSRILRFVFPTSSESSQGQSVQNINAFMTLQTIQQNQRGPDARLFPTKSFRNLDALQGWLFRS